ATVPPEGLQRALDRSRSQQLRRLEEALARLGLALVTSAGALPALPGLAIPPKDARCVLLLGKVGGPIYMTTGKEHGTGAADHPTDAGGQLLRVIGVTNTTRSGPDRGLKESWYQAGDMQISKGRAAAAFLSGGVVKELRQVVFSPAGKRVLFAR